MIRPSLFATCHTVPYSRWNYRRWDSSPNFRREISSWLFFDFPSTLTSGKREVTYKDRLTIPYTEAVLLETSRVSNIAPLGISHTLDEDIIIDYDKVSITARSRNILFCKCKKSAMSIVFPELPTHAVRVDKPQLQDKIIIRYTNTVTDFLWEQHWFLTYSHQ